MPKKGIHPLLRTVTYVLKNGASVQLPSVLQKSVPYILQVDTTTNPLWTGEKKVVSSGGRSAKMMRRYEKMGFKFTEDAEEPAKQQPVQQPGPA
ncbi:hypothetical protein ABBQ38_014562 [Trebouxia sp. C0009 RCD-2024]